MAKKDLTLGTYEGEQVPKLTKWVYSVSGMFRDACYTLVSGFLLTYIMYSGVLGPTTDDYNAQIAVINALFIIFLVWDGINDPLFGMILEKCHLKTGKFRPWILIGGILNSIIVVLLFTIRPTGWAFVATWAVFYFLWDSVFTLNDIGYWAMLPSMSSDEKVRAKITTLMGIFVSLGTFIMYAICSLLPSADNYHVIYAYIAIPTCVLFCLSQIAIFFLCKEKKRDPKQEEISSKTKFRDLFTVLKNKPLRRTVESLFFYQTGCSLLVGIGLTYFYLLYGYGGDYGGTIMVIYTVCYALGSLGSQALFGLIIKKFKKQTIWAWSAIIAIVGYIWFFLVTAPIFGGKPLADGNHDLTGMAFAFSGTMVLGYIPVIIFFAAQQVFYLTLIIGFQNTIEYNEWKYGERKESVIFSWRPLDVKLGSAVQKGVIYLTLAASGLFTLVISKISEAEQKMAEIISGNPDLASQAKADTEATINNLISSVEPRQLIIMGVFMVGSMLVCMLLSWLFLRFGYHLNEDEYAKIVADLEVTRKKDEEEASNKVAVAEEAK